MNISLPEYSTYGTFSVLQTVPSNIMLDLAFPLTIMIVGSGLVLGCTTPHSLLRSTQIPINVALVYRILCTSAVYLRKNHGRLLGSFVAGILFHWIDIALISRWAFEGDDQTSRTRTGVRVRIAEKKAGADHTSRSWLQRVQWGTSSLFESRRLNTIQEAKNVPVLAPWLSRSRVNFLCYAIGKLAICYLAIDLLTPAPPLSAEQSAKLFDLRQIPILTRLWNRQPIAPQELIFRTAFTFRFWLLTYSMMTGVVTATSIICVGSGMHEPHDWKPFFGSLSQAYSMRGFWGKFWHQAFRYPFGNAAAWFVESCLSLKTTRGDGALKQRTIRYAKLFCTFAVSGLFHVAGDLAAKGNVRNHQTTRFFLTQAAGIMIEDHLVELYRALVGEPRSCGAKLLERTLGYTWCAAFLVWTTPQWMYPSFVTNTSAEKPFLPFSVKPYLMR